jgi:hypothetical protein
MDSIFKIKQQRVLVYADSVFQVRRREISILHLQVMKEVDEYKSAAIYNVDTMRANFLALKRTKIYNNVIIRGDTLHNAEVSFGTDSIPKLIFK